ncbi:YraN family protein [Breznakiella homolactica]|uniref:UPF0102 protein JFL75_01935 n=1 Tax=Breznakiella homolactica TaxID=2798577 RepID=A0A7T7XNV3_9SPIR|nr:YraN family protein [Breznakiella homolactica]QQO09702.1 YraN family protein [Breznakiella homolactica]
MTNSAAGTQGESRAARFLADAGMSVVGRNFRSQYGEVDIIAKDGDTLVFVEVKSWRGYGFDALEQSIDMKKQRRIIETAKYFLSSHREYNSMAVRFDVVFVSPRDIQHLVSAFME